MKYDEIAILIPSFNPGKKLIKVVDLLHKNGFNNIFVVDDGSVKKDAFSKMNVSKIIVNDKNMGKGFSLKKGFEYLKNLNYLGLITIDDDLQQDISDVIKIADLFLKSNGVYLGVRDFKGAPILRRFANKVSSLFFKSIYGISIVDTQTGLRCFPCALLNDLTKVCGDRFEYEMNVLKYLVNNKIHISEVPIKTIYNDNGSHFNSIIDSYKILKVMFDKNNF
ncbi:MAG: glycosyltransferase family 2 protein [Bacilli bacterium]|nr:glycosyltransferase family 2 protein [Bacilli bacterium]